MTSAQLDAKPKGEHGIVAQALTRVCFAPYGDMLDAQALQVSANGTGKRGGNGNGNEAAPSVSPINAGTGLRHDGLMQVELMRDGGQPCVTVFTTAGDAHRPPYRLQAFERHQLGSQSFIPLAQSRCLAIVALGKHTPDLDTVAAFVVEPGQAVTIHPGIWHHPLLSIGPAQILVLERQAADTDCEIVSLAAIGQSLVVSLG